MTGVDASVEIMNAERNSVQEPMPVDMAKWMPGMVKMIEKQSQMMMVMMKSQIAKNEDESDDGSDDLSMVAADKRVRLSYRNRLPDKHGNFQKYCKNLIERNDRGSDVFARIQCAIAPQTNEKNVFTTGHCTYLQPGLAQLTILLMIDDLSERINVQAEKEALDATKHAFVKEVLTDLCLH